MVCQLASVCGRTLIVAFEVPVEAVVPLQFAGEAVEECGDELYPFVYRVVQDAVQDLVGLEAAGVRFLGHEEVFELGHANPVEDGHPEFSGIPRGEVHEGQDELLHAKRSVHVQGRGAREELLDVLGEFECRMDMFRDSVCERVIAVHAHEHTVELGLDGEVAGDTFVHHLVDVLVPGTVQCVVQDEAEKERQFLLAGLVGPAAELVVAVMAFQEALGLHSLTEVLMDVGDEVLDGGVLCGVYEAFRGVGSCAALHLLEDLGADHCEVFFAGELVQ